MNGLHLIWITGLLGSFYFALRRHFSPLLSLGGLYLLVSLPLLLVHAVNPYADIFLASHVLLGVLCVYRIAQAADRADVRTWLKLGSFVLGLLFFTKNEASVLYAPLIALLLSAALLWKQRESVFESKELRKLVALAAGIVLVLALPWLSFKWFHGLSFGNAKSITGMAIAMHPDVLGAIWFHLSHEVNWLLLPLVLPVLVLLSGKDVLRRPEVLLIVFVVAAMLLQFSIYLFTPLATEAIRQTGLGRGLLHIAPVAMFLVILLTERLLKKND